MSRPCFNVFNVLVTSSWDFLGGTFLPVPAGSAILSGFMPFISHTADITSFTAIGGFFIAFTIETSEGWNIFVRHLKQQAIKHLLNCSGPSGSSRRSRPSTCSRPTARPPGRGWRRPSRSRTPSSEPRPRWLWWSPPPRRRAPLCFWLPPRRTPPRSPGRVVTPETMTSCYITYWLLGAARRAFLMLFYFVLLCCYFFFLPYWLSE